MNAKVQKESKENDQTQAVENNKKKVQLFKSKYLLRFLDGDGWITGNHVTITDKYFEFRKRNWHLISVDVRKFHWQSAEDINVDKHIFGATIVLSTKGGAFRLCGISKRTADRILDLATDYISLNSQRGTTEALADAIATAVGQGRGAASVSNADELRKMKDLFESGVITQKEFEQAKKKLL